MDPLTNRGQALWGCVWVDEGLPALWEPLALARTDKVLSADG